LVPQAAHPQHAPKAIYALTSKSLLSNCGENVVYVHTSPEVLSKVHRDFIPDILGSFAIP
jgi:hypothetical protein